ncbi:MAG: YfhO family protein [Lachnospiraceae bacterium]|nr:YfhO family protein [Lachnospiraceae bacterium]
MLSFAAAVLSFGWFILAHGGLFTVAGDFNVQQIPFAMHAQDAIKSGNVIWDWSLDLGSNFIGGMAFYVLGNPSFWLSLLVPSRWFMYVVGWIYVLKYAMAGLTSYLWISRFVKDRRYALPASLMYAFSGFMSTNLLFYHFHDVVVLFPLMLLAVDLAMEEGRYGFLIPATALNALVNYFFLPGEIIFLAAYFFLRYGYGNMAESVRKLPRLLFEGLVGGLLSAALLLPAAVFTMSNPRVKFDYTGSNSLVFTAERYLFILKGMIFPGEVMSNQSAVIERNFSSCAAYIPMAGMIFVIAFICLHKKHWITRMLVFCLIMAAVPILNASFSLFAGLYHRWYYMPVLLFALAGALVLEQIDEEAETEESETDPGGDPYIMESAPSYRACSTGTVIWGLLTVFFIAYLLFVPWSASEPSKVYDMELFAVWCCTSALGTILTWLILLGGRRRRYLYFLAGIFLFSVGTTAAAIALYNKANGESAETLHERIELSRTFPDPSPSYRYGNRDNPETLTHGYPSTANFCSTVSGSIFRFYEALGLKRDVKSPEAPDGMLHLISARYYYSKGAAEDHGMLYDTWPGENYTYYIYEDASVPPIGYTYDTYITASEFSETNEKARAVLMFKTLVVPDACEEEVSRVLRHYEPERDGDASAEHLRDIGAAHIRESAEDPVRTSSSYEVSIRADAEKYAFFSIPNDDGWTAYVDGDPAEILDINGMMAVRIKKGENRILFQYQVPGLKEGISLSVLGLAVWAVYAVISVKRRKRMIRRTDGDGTETPKDEGDGDLRDDLD